MQRQQLSDGKLGESVDDSSCMVNTISTWTRNYVCNMEEYLVSY